MNPKQKNLSDPSLQDIAQILASFRTVNYTSWSVVVGHIVDCPDIHEPPFYVPNL